MFSYIDTNVFILNKQNQVKVRKENRHHCCKNVIKNYSYRYSDKKHQTVFDIVPKKWNLT